LVTATERNCLSGAGTQPIPLMDRLRNVGEQIFGIWLVPLPQVHPLLALAIKNALLEFNCRRYDRKAGASS
jgi:hypothetical protein